MTILSCHEIRDEEGFEFSTSGITHTRCFRIVTDTPTTSSVAAYTAAVQSRNAGVAPPVAGDVHPDDSYSYVSAINCKRVQNCIHVATVTYGWPFGQSMGGGIAGQNPTEYHPLPIWSEVRTTEPIDTVYGNIWTVQGGVRTLLMSANANGNALTTTAGEDFDPKLQEEFCDDLLTIVRYKTSWSPSEIWLYRDHVNEYGWYGAAPGVARCVGVSNDTFQSGSYTLIQVTYKFQFRPTGWNRRILNAGFRYRSLTDEGIELYLNSEGKAFDSNGNPYTRDTGTRPRHPVPLSAYGFLLDPDNPCRQFTSNELVWLEIQRYPYANFQALNLE